MKYTFNIKTKKRLIYASNKCSQISLLKTTISCRWAFIGIPNSWWALYANCGDRWTSSWVRCPSSVTSETGRSGSTLMQVGSVDHYSLLRTDNCYSRRDTLIISRKGITTTTGQCYVCCIFCLIVPACNKYIANIRKCRIENESSK